MKVIIVLCLLAVAAYAEKCTVNSDCQSTMCSSGFHVICEHSQETGVSQGGGLCTCAKDNYQCATQADCIATSLNCIDDSHKHCYDGKCICTRW